MVYASKEEVFEEGYASGVEVTLPLAYLRLAVCCLTSLDVIWMDADYATTTLTDEERDVLDNAIAAMTEAVNDA